MENMTEWYVGVNPVRNGLYKVRSNHSQDTGQGLWCYWEGNYWAYVMLEAVDALTLRQRGPTSLAIKAWRGLTEYAE